jgi:hypothetical protein
LFAFRQTLFAIRQTLFAEKTSNSDRAENSRKNVDEIDPMGRFHQSSLPSKKMPAHGI